MAEERKIPSEKIDLSELDGFLRAAAQNLRHSAPQLIAPRGMLTDTERAVEAGEQQELEAIWAQLGDQPNRVLSSDVVDEDRGDS